MSDLPVYTAAELELEDPFEVDSFDNEDAVDLGLATLEVIDERGLSLAVRIVLRGDLVFQAKLGRTDAGNDEYLHGKALLATRFGIPSLLVKRRIQEAGEEFVAAHPDERFSGGSVPILVGGEVVGTITTSGEPDVIDHATTVEAIRRYRSR